MDDYRKLADSVVFYRNTKGISVTAKSDELECIGAGRSAFVFRISGSEKVIKVFFPEFKETAKEEAEIYQVLQGISFYPTLYSAGDDYLVIDYIEGRTLFDCLAEGTAISEDKINEIDYALGLAAEKGLNPSDIHLRNILLTSGGEIKIIDVARFRQKKSCRQWDDLKMAFFKLYRKWYFPKKIPPMLLNMIAALYKKRWIPTLL